MAADTLLPYDTTLRASAKRYPRNYDLAHTEVWASRIAARPDLERIAANRAVRNAPRNPDAYLTYAFTLSNAAQAVRKGKFSTMMSAKEARFVESVYPQWYSAAHRAVELDPNHGTACMRVAESGTFAGERNEAPKAYDRARQLLRPKKEILEWGLHMFHPKWLNNPAKLREVAEDASKADYPNPYDAIFIVNSLKNAQMGEFADALTENLLKRSDAAIAADPKDGRAHYDRALALARMAHWKDASEEYQNLARLYSDNAQMLYEVGAYFAERSKWLLAENYLNQAIRLNPRHIRAMTALGYVYKKQRKWADAERILQTVVVQAPHYSEGFSVLGTTFLMQNKYDAAQAPLEQAIALTSYNGETYANLLNVYQIKKEWKKAAEAATLFPEEGHFPSVMGAAIGAALLETKQYTESEAASRRAISLDDSNAVSHHNLGMALIGQKKIAEGRTELQRGLFIGRRTRYA